MSEASPIIVLKVEILFSILKKDGFQLTTDNYADMLFVTAILNPGSLSDIANQLCAIAATSDIEQARFHELIQRLDDVSLNEIKESYDIGTSDQSTTATGVEKELPGNITVNGGKITGKKNGNKWVWLTLTISLLLAAGVYYYCNYLHREIIIFSDSQTNAAATIQKGDTLLLDASGRVPEGVDTSKLDFSWNFSSKQIVHGFRVKHVFHNAGDTLIGMAVRSDYYRINKTGEYYHVYVCNYIPKISSFKISSALAVGSVVKISAVTNDTVSHGKWIIDDTTRITGRSISKVFTKEGYHTVSYSIVAGDTTCSARRDTTIEVIDQKRHYTVTVKGYNAPPQLVMEVKQWVPFLIWTVAMGCVTLLFFVFRRQVKTVFLDETGASKKSIFEVPFSTNDLGTIRPGKKIYKMLHLMRRRADEEILQLDIPLTLQKTMRNRGLTDFVFNPRRKFQDYVLLIDMTIPQGSFSYLFTFLSDLMLKMDVRLSVYYFDRQFYFQNKQSSVKLSLQQLANNHPNALPIIMGDGHILLYSLFPIIKNKLLATFNQWENRLIISPIPRNEWGQREKVLAKYFSISSADEDEMLKLIETIHLMPGQQKENDIAVAVDNTTEISNITDAFAYLNEDERLTQWLCALAVYPKFRWGLLTEFGDVLARRYKLHNGVSYSDILKMSRIFWLRDGSMPASIRLALLKKLTIGNEVAVRTELVKMLEKARLSGDGYYYDSELEDQLIINKFILYVNNPVDNSAYASEVAKFNNLWQNGLLLDGSLRLYLENAKGQEWPTPLHSSGKTISLGAYFKKVAQKWTPNRYYVTASWLVIIAVAFGANSYLNSATAAKNGLTAGLFSPVANQSVNIKYKLVKDTKLCDKAGSTFVSDLTGNFIIDGKSIPVKYDNKNKTIEATVPYEAITKKIAGIRLTMDSGNPSYAENDIAMSPLYTNGTITFTCKNTIDSPPVGPKVDSLPLYLSEIWQGGSSNRFININTRNRVLYYSTGDVKSYRTYGIEEVDIIKPNVYKIITKTDKGYKLFFIKNALPTSFGLSVCQGFAQAKAELEGKDTSYCEHFNTMHLYYLKDTDKVFYPANKNSTALVQSELNKLKKLIASTGNNDYKITHYKGPNAVTNNLSELVLQKASFGKGIYSSIYENLIVSPTPFQRDYDMISHTPPVKTRLLWVDDYPQNNAALYDYFTKNNIQVDRVATNNDAFIKLNATTYNFIITDIGRSKQEPCVDDIKKAGVEFINAVKFPKEYIIVFSPDTTIAKNKSELLKYGMNAGNLSSNGGFVQKFILSNAGKGNTILRPQQLCAEPKIGGSTKTDPPLPASKDTVIKNTYLSYIGIIGQIRSRVNVNTPLKALNIDLNLNNAPKGKIVSFHYSITKGECAGKQADVVLTDTVRKQIFSECGMTLTIQIIKIASGKVYFDAIINQTNTEYIKK
jgi:hypothetical protein